ncbi:AraC family transcriptional regulator [Aestuariibius insulae]|uniref:AraC family transcriptional regulator n=1 Tax=Aestuariibius insulae TaxID=2058287 RepID=UPI00345E8277
MDPLSGIISLLHPHDCVAAGFDAAGDWSIQFEAHEGLKCNAVIHGACWIQVEGEDAVHLTAGDCVILPRGRPFRLSARPTRMGEDAQVLYSPVRHGGTAVYGAGGEFFMSGARFLLSGPQAGPLLRGLPPLIVLRASPESEALRWTLERIMAELREAQPGSTLSVTHLSHLLLLQVMRGHLASGAATGPGWIAALSDPRIAPAVEAMHDDPAQNWTVEDLAAVAGQSRTSFAVRFKAVTDRSPIEYLTEWRMLLAAERLRNGRTPVARIAADIGYTSESAFGVAFKRVMGHAPRQFAKRSGATD